MKCISCGAVLKVLGEVQGFTIYKCPVCGLGKTEGLRTDYQNYHRDANYIVEEKQFKNIFSKRVHLITKYKNAGKVLDIGSSTGAMLSLFKDKGWEVQGIEPSKTSSKKAEDSGIPTLSTTFEKADIKNFAYDVVIMNHVLEHVQNPLEFLKMANKLLKKDGIILIDIPNFGGFSASLFGANWQYILPKEHIWHFTNISLKNILEKSGFKISFQETHSGVWGYGNPLEELADSLFGAKKRFFTNAFTAIPSWFISMFGMGSGLTIVAKK